MPNFVDIKYFESCIGWHLHQLIISYKFIKNIILYLLLDTDNFFSDQDIRILPLQLVITDLLNQILDN